MSKPQFLPEPVQCPKHGEQRQMRLGTEDGGTKDFCMKCLAESMINPIRKSVRFIASPVENQRFIRDWCKTSI